MLDNKHYLDLLLTCYCLVTIIRIIAYPAYGVYWPNHLLYTVLIIASVA